MHESGTVWDVPEEYYRARLLYLASQKSMALARVLAAEKRAKTMALT